MRSPGTITAGNASGVNDGAAAIDPRQRRRREGPWSEAARACARHGVGGGAAADHGYRPGAVDAQSTERLALKIGDFDLISSTRLRVAGSSCLRALGVTDDAEHVNPHGGAIALGHPLGMSGARLASTACTASRSGGKRALATMCVGVGQGVSLAVELV